MIVVPIATIVVPEFVAEPFQRKAPWEHDSWWNTLRYGFLFTLAVASSYAIPGYITFLVLGIPTLYLLYRWNRLGFGWFMFFGALYTALPFLFLRSNYAGHWASFRAGVSSFGPVGVLGGLLTRLIIFGRK